MEEPLVLVSRSKLSEIIGISQKQIRIWEKEDLPYYQPSKNTTRFNLPEVLKWMRERSITKPWEID